MDNIFLKILLLDQTEPTLSNILNILKSWAQPDLTQPMDGPEPMYISAYIK